MKLKFCCRFPPFFPCLGCIYKPQAAADPLLFFLPAQTRFLPLTTPFFSCPGSAQKPYFCCRSPTPVSPTPLQATQDLFGTKYCTRSSAGYRRTHMVHLYKSTNYGKARSTMKMYQATQDFAAPPLVTPEAVRLKNLGLQREKTTASKVPKHSFSEGGLLL